MKIDDWIYKSLLLISLSRYGDNLDIKFFKKYYKQGAPSFAKIFFVIAIKKIGSLTIIPDLVKAFKIESDIPVKGYIIETIFNLGKESYFPVMKKLYEEASFHDRFSFIQRAENISPENEIFFLKDLYDFEKDGTIKQRIAEKILRLVKNNRILIFESDNGEWKLKKIPNLYRFTSYLPDQQAHLV